MIPGHGVRLSVLTLAVVLAAGSVQPRFKIWPEVLPVHRHFVFASGKSASVDMIIRTRQEKAAYRLECHPGSYSDPNFTYAGAFDCRLVSDSLQGGYSSLLTEDPYQSTDATRGRFFSNQVTGRCATYPEYGAVRHFSLRGMRLTLALSKPAEDLGRGEVLKSFDFTVTVRPDPDALSGIAEPPGIPPPDMGHCDALPLQARERASGPVYAKGDNGRQRWPVILPAKGQIVFSSGPSRQLSLGESGELIRFGDAWPRLEVPVVDRDGKVQYVVRCGKFVPAVGIWGVACGLFDQNSGTNLFLSATDPYSLVNRAFLLPPQVTSRLREDPAWGRRREFVLRGMQISLMFDHAEFEDAPAEGSVLLKRVRVSCRIQPNSAATNAEPPVPERPFLDIYQ